MKKFELKNSTTIRLCYSIIFFSLPFFKPHALNRTNFLKRSSDRKILSTLYTVRKRKRGGSDVLERCGSTAVQEISGTSSNNLSNNLQFTFINIKRFSFKIYEGKIFKRNMKKWKLGNFLVVRCIFSQFIVRN